MIPQDRTEEYYAAILGAITGEGEATAPSPVWRIEEFLDAFITYIWEDGDHPRKPCPEPVWRLEECLRAIYDVMTGAATPWAFPTPTNRIEEYLAAIHAYLADNTELPVPEPVWRIEQWLAYALDAVKHGGGVTKTVSGSPAHITDALAKAALSVLTSIEPIQDLHGYDHPWPAGGGVNKFPPMVDGTYEGNGVKAVVVNGVATLSGTATASGNAFIIPLAESFTVPSGCYYHLGNSEANASFSPTIENGNNTSENTSHSCAPANRISAELSSKVGQTYTRVRFYIAKGVTISGTYAPMMCLDNTARDFTPYENICPISGRTGLSVYVSPTQDQQDATTYAVDWTTPAGTVYGGTLDVVTGVLTVDRASISSYAGETLPGAWISDRDVYAPGTSPTTGAQVVYELATPLTYQLTAQEVQMLLGENYVWSSSGDTVSVTYYAEGNANPLQSLNILLGGNYSNPKTADDVSDKEALDIILGGNK